MPASTPFSVGRRVATLFASALTILFLFQSPVVAQPANLEGLDAYIEAAMVGWEQPGLAIAIVKDDRIIYERGFGVTARGGSEPVDEHTLFAIASTTKAFTAAAVGLMVDDGKLHWDDAVRRHLPEYRVLDDYVSQEVTLRDMLTHRVGVASHNNVWIAAPFDRKELVRRARFLPQDNEFRTRYNYNNHMYVAAGEVAGTVAGSTWDDLLEERIFGPLNMARTTTRLAVAEANGNIASPHLRVNGEVTPVARRNYDALGGAGSMFSSVHDMAQWVRMHLNKGEFEGRRILSEDVVTEMHTRQVRIGIGASTARMFPDRTYSYYGLGWRLHDYAGYDVVQHTGTVNFMRTQVGMIPSEGIGVVVLSNFTSTTLQTALMYRVFDLLLERPERDWSGEYLASAGGSSRSSGNARPAATSPSLDLEGYAGVYSDSLYGDIYIDLEGDGLVLRYSPDYVADLEHWEDDTFRAVWRSTGFGSSMASFRINVGSVSSMTLRGYTTFGYAGPSEAVVTDPHQALVPAEVDG